MLLPSIAAAVAALLVVLVAVSLSVVSRARWDASAFVKAERMSQDERK
jgi:hypothetical protein